MRPAQRSTQIARMRYSIGPPVKDKIGHLASVETPLMAEVRGRKACILSLVRHAKQSHTAARSRCQGCVDGQAYPQLELGPLSHARNGGRAIVRLSAVTTAQVGRRRKYEGCGGRKNMHSMDQLSPQAIHHLVADVGFKRPFQHAGLAATGRRASKR